MILQTTLHPLPFQGALKQTKSVKRLKKVLKTHRFFVGDGDGKIQLISRLGELRDFEAQLNDAALPLEVIDVRLSDDGEVNDTGVWRVQCFHTLCTVIATHTYIHTYITYHRCGNQGGRRSK